jgi:cell division protein FtsW
MSPRHLRQLLLVVLSGFVGLGLVAVYSSSAMVAHATYGDSTWFLKRHIVAVACGLVLGLGVLMVPYAWLRGSARWLWAAGVIALALVLLLGPKIGGAQRWFRLGPLSIQPSEFVQLFLILYLADLLARRGDAIRDFWRGLAAPLAATGIVAGMVLLQPDLGTATAMGAVALMLLIAARARWHHLALVVGVAGAAFVLLVAGEEYRRRRILAFLDPWQDPQGSGYQILQSYVALASGGLFGVGIGNSVQRLFYLPGAHTDFIFAIIGEELGLLGTTAVLGLLGLFLTCGFRIAIAAHDPFSKYLVCGLVGMIGLEALLNISVVTGLLPTKGLPFPLVSYGGTAMVVNLMAVALIFQASRHGERYVPERAAGR